MATPIDPFGNATTGKLGMWLFLVMDALSFATLLMGGVALRASSPTWPEPGIILNIPLTAFNTFLLISTSFTMVSALNAFHRGHRDRTVLYLLLTFAGGVLFLGIQMWEYIHFVLGGNELAAGLARSGLGGTSFLPSSGLYGATFYVTTGFHGAHVLSGVIYIGTVVIDILRNGTSARDANRIEILGLFWHFVDLIWILVFTLIYLI